MSKLTGRKFFLSLAGVIIVTAIAFLILIPCVVRWDWSPAYTLLPGVLFALSGIIGAFIALQVIQEYNISKNYIQELTEKTDQVSKKT